MRIHTLVCITFVFFSAPCLSSLLERKAASTIPTHNEQNEDDPIIITTSINLFGDQEEDGFILVDALRTFSDSKEPSSPQHSKSSFVVEDSIACSNTRFSSPSPFYSPSTFISVTHCPFSPGRRRLKKKKMSKIGPPIPPFSYLRSVISSQIGFDMYGSILGDSVCDEGSTDVEGKDEENETMVFKVSKKLSQKLLQQSAPSPADVKTINDVVYAYKRIHKFPLQDCFHLKKKSTTQNSTVYSGYLTTRKEASKEVMLKFGFPNENSHNSIEMEYKILYHLRESPGIPKIYGIYQNSQNLEYRAFFSMEIIPFDNDAHIRMTIEDIPVYGRQLLDVIKHANQFHLIHGDIKPENILINHSLKHLTLIDWGNSKIRKPGYTTELRDVCCTEWWRAPEMELSHDWSFPVDIWSFGIVVTNWLFMNTYITSSRHEITSKVGFPLNILKVLGSAGFVELADLDEGSKSLRWNPLSSSIEYEGWDKIKTIYGCCRSQEELDDGIEFLTFVLKYIPSERPTADDILEHKYFK